jgi:hypothetical protein
MDKGRGKEEGEYEVVSYVQSKYTLYRIYNNRRTRDRGEGRRNKKVGDENGQDSIWKGRRDVQLG